MIMIKFRSASEHTDLLTKVEHMKKYISELEECLEEAVENEDLDYRDRRYPEYEPDDEEMYARRGGRYGYIGRSRM